MYFFPFHTKSRVDFECQFWYLVHRPFKNFEFIVDSADVIFHLADCIDTADKFTVILEDEWLDLMVMYFDLLVDLVVTADQLADWILFEHAHYIAFGVEIGGVDVHGIYFMWLDLFKLKECDE